MADKHVIPFRGKGKVGSTATALYDSFGNELPINLSTTEVDVDQLSIAGTTITATAAEINSLDQSAQTETIDSGDAVDITIAHTAIDNTTGGAGAITLAAPGADMLGKVKTIEMTVDGGDVTLALTNVTGGSAATTATFDAVDEALVLVGGTNAWHVIAESGVTLS